MLNGLLRASKEIEGQAAVLLAVLLKHCFEPALK